MHTHLHAIVGVPGDPDPEKILGDLFQCAATIEVIRYRVSREHTASSHPARRIKAWCTRKLNSRWGKRASGTWWTTSGSCRKLSDGKAVETVLHYIRRQPNPHVVWTVEDGR